ncbi:hypothetical protein bcgnr5380_35060 [Bacillus cereus]
MTIIKEKKLGLGYLQLPTMPLSIGIEKKTDIKQRQLKNSIYRTYQVQNVPSTEHEYFVKHEIASWLYSLSSLPLERRNVLLLRDYYGFSYKEIAEMTGLSLAKVKIELHRGRKETRNIKE